jgi:hypothetical protein
MTCIVGYLTDENDIYMGSDSIGVADTAWMLLKDPKIFIKDSMIFGFASSLRFGQILKYSFVVPDRPDGMDTNEYMCHVVMLELTKTFEKTDFKRDDKEQEDWSLLLGYDGKLFTVQSNLQIIEDLKNYATIGCGGDYAKGALYAMEKTNHITPEERITIALEAATEFSMVKPPFHILKLEAKGTINQETDQQEIFFN